MTYMAQFIGEPEMSGHNRRGFSSAETAIDWAKDYVRNESRQDPRYANGFASAFVIKNEQTGSVVAEVSAATLKGDLI